MMHKKPISMLLILPMTFSIALAIPVVREKAVSTLDAVRGRIETIYKISPREVDDGADSVVGCISNLSLRWGGAVLNSISTNPELKNDVEVKSFESLLDLQNQNLNFINTFRPGFKIALDQQINEELQNNSITAVPTDLNFENYAQYDSMFFKNLAVCTDNNFINRLESKVAQVSDSSTVVSGSFTVGEVAVRYKTPTSNEGSIGVIKLEKEFTQRNISGQKSYNEWIYKMLKSFK